MRESPEKSINILWDGGVTAGMAYIVLWVLLEGITLGEEGRQKALITNSMTHLRLGKKSGSPC